MFNICVHDIWYLIVACCRLKMEKVLSQLNKQRPLVGVVQMTSTEHKDDNFKVAKALIEKAHRQGAQVECFNSATNYVQYSSCTDTYIQLGQGIS